MSEYKERCLLAPLVMELIRMRDRTSTPKPIRAHLSDDRERGHAGAPLALDLSRGQVEGRVVCGAGHAAVLDLCAEDLALEGEAQVGALVGDGEHLAVRLNDQVLGAVDLSDLGWGRRGHEGEYGV